MPNLGNHSNVPFRTLTLALIGVLLGIGLSVSTAMAAMAESPLDLVDALADDGVYVAPSRTDIDEQSLVAVVNDLRFDAHRVVVVAPVDPEPNAKAFARRIQEATSADAAIIFPVDGQLEAFAIDDLAGSRVRAISSARELTDPARAVQVFVSELTAEPTSERPALVDRLMTVAVLLTLVLGLALAFEQGLRRAKRPKQASPAVSSGNAEHQNSVANGARSVENA